MQVQIQLIPDTPSAWWLIALTAGLVMVGAVQVIMFFFQWRAMRDGVDRSAKAADAATNQAIIAQDTFKNVERPYLYVFNVGSLELEETMTEDGPEQIGFVKYTVANYGKVAGIVEEVFVDLCTSGDAAPVGNAPLVDLGHTLMSNRIFPPGHERNVKDYACSGPDYFLRQEDGPNVSLDAGQAMFCHVLIKYRGPFTQGHETSACWKMGPSDNYFVEFGHGDFNFVH